MEKVNPVFDYPEEISMSEVMGGADNNTSTDRAKPTSGKKVSGRMCAITVSVSLFAIIAMLSLVAVIAIVVFRPTTSESNVSTSSEQVTQEDMRNLWKALNKQAVQHAVNISILKEEQSNVVQELQNQLNRSVLTTQVMQKETNEKLNRSNFAIHELQNQLNNSKTTILNLQQQLNESKVSLDARIDNSTRLHQQSYLDCKETALTLNEQTQSNVSQQIQAQASKCTENILSLQLQVNHSNTDIDTLAVNLTQISRNFELKIEELKINLIQNTTTTEVSQLSLSCEELPSLANGSVSVQTGPNSLINGLGSVATYDCNHGYALVGPVSRTCQDTNGGTVTTGTWSGVEPTCQDIHCTELGGPDNGRVMVSNSELLVDTVAVYSCDEGYVLVGDTVRTCEEDPTGHETEGTWNGTQPRCEAIVRCSSLTSPANGRVDISIGDNGVTLGAGAVATYTCNSGYGLVGGATRTCLNTGTTSGAWNGTTPTCQLVIACPSLSPPTNGVVTFTPGDGNSNIGLGSVATFSCNVGYVLVGVTSLTCQSLYNGASGGWSGHAPICREAVYCPALLSPSNGSVSVSSGVNYLSVGSVATYTCHYGYILVGVATRNCADPDGDSVGTWTGTMPQCQIILCPGLMSPVNGSVVISSTVLGLGTTASYTCNQGTVPVGDLTRTCETGTGGALGEWTGTDTECAIPNRAMIDCQNTACRYETLVCPEHDNCTVDCPDSRQYACFQTDLFCPSGRGDCTLNCDDDYACLQTNTTCPQGNCAVNCQSDYTCLSSNFQCSGDNCLFNCRRQEACSDSMMECTSDSCTMNCAGRESCQRSNILCSGGNCTVYGKNIHSLRYSTISCPPNGLCVVNCTGDHSCRSTRLTCPNGGNCLFTFHGEYQGYDWIGASSTITCEENSTCNIYCSGQDNAYIDNQCSYSRITCHPDSRNCSVECSGYYSCQYSTISCGRDPECITCSGQYSCQYSTITLPNIALTTPSTCTNESSNSCQYLTNKGLNCTGRYSCQNSRLICPTDSPCNIRCNGQYSCQNSDITCPTNGSCGIHCNGQYSCRNSDLTCPTNDNCIIRCNDQHSCQNSELICPTNSNCTIHCNGQYSCNNARVTCPPGDYSCAILCTDPLSCQHLSITNTDNVYLQCCGGLSCAGTTVTPASTDCPYIQ